MAVVASNTSSSRGASFIFAGMIAYLALVGCVTFAFRYWTEQEELKSETLRDLALLAFEFSEENYHTQLEAWAYAFEPNAKRLKAYQGHARKFDELLAALTAKTQAAQNLLNQEAKESIAAMESAGPGVKENWIKILKAIALGRPDHEVRAVVFAAEEFFNKSHFTKKALAFTNEVRSASRKLEAVNKTRRLLLAFFEISSILLGIGVVLHSKGRIQRLEQKNQAQRAKALANSKLAALGEMAGGVAHEINNPLAVIQQLVGQMQEIVDEEPLDKGLVKQMTGQIEVTTKRIAKIVLGLRSISRDGSKDPMSPVNVQVVLQETLSFCSERLKSHGVEVVVADFDHELAFMGRSVEISQVLLNLLNNAHDAIHEQPEKWIKIAVLKSERWIEMQVTDSGKGIRPEVQQKLFQSFFTTKEIGKGTGLGLSISRAILQAHQGELTLDAQCPNTRFVIRLPARQSATNSASATAA